MNISARNTASAGGFSRRRVSTPIIFNPSLTGRMVTFFRSSLHDPRKNVAPALRCLRAAETGKRRCSAIDLAGETAPVAED